MDLVSESVATTLGIDPRRGIAPAPSKVGAAVPAVRGAPDWVKQAAPAHDDTPAGTKHEAGTAGLVEIPCPLCAGPLLVSPDDREGACPHCEAELEFEVETGEEQPPDARRPAKTAALAPAGPAFDPTIEITVKSAPLVRLKTTPEPPVGPAPDEEPPAAPIAAASTREDGAVAPRKRKTTSRRKTAIEEAGHDG